MFDLSCYYIVSAKGSIQQGLEEYADAIAYTLEQFDIDVDLDANG